MKFNKKLFLFIMVTLLVVFALSGCGIIPKTPDGKISGRILIPPSEMSKDIAGWVAAANAVVTIVDADGVTHTATTDENGYYTFEGIAVNSNTVITAEVELNGDALVLKDIISQPVTADEQCDAGDMDPESTALALVVEALLAGGMDLEDINLEDIESNDYFSDLVERITAVLEERGNITTDPDIADMIEDIVNPPVPPSPPSPSPTTKLPVYNQTQKTYHATIQKAINNSSIDDIIVVSPGIYKENIVFDNKNITLKSTNPADSAVVVATIIDGQDLDSVVKMLNGDTSTLEGFTIQNGNEPSYDGGGIFISGSSPVIRYNVIGDNIDDDVDTGNTGDCGGGICIVDDSIDPHIYENIIIGNTGINGGGMYIGWGSPLVENNTIKENISVNDGGGISVVYSKANGKSYCPIIRGNNIIEYNKTTKGYGGGIAVSEEGSAIIENNQIKNNETNYNGGGIYIAFSSDADIRGNNTIEDNKAGHDGGGIYIYSDGIISITANIINNNMANIDSNSYSGGGIYVDDGSPTIGGNTDTNSFNTICGNSPDQVNPDTYPNNDLGYDVNLAVSPGSCGTVTGGGNYCESTEAQIEAIAESGYRFVNWTDDDNAGIEVSTDNPYTFIPDQDVNYTANFFHWTSEIKIYDLGSEQYLDIGDTVVGTNGYDIRYENISAYTIYIILCDQYSCISAAEEIASAGSFSEFRQGKDDANPNELILIETLAGYDHGWKITWNQKGL